MTTPRDDIAGLSERLRKWNDEWPNWEFTERQHDVMRLVLDYSAEAATQLDSLLKERDALKDLAKELSDALLAVRPLGGSELFIKRFDRYYADPVYCKAAIEERHKDCHEAQKGLVRYRRQAEKAEQERDALQARVKELESGIAHAQYRSDNCDAENQSLYNRLEAVESRALRAEQERDVFEAQLPDGMKHCTITFHECEKGHGWLSATNWIDNGCLCCQRDEAYERAAKEAESHCYGSTGRAIGKRIRRLAGPEKEGK